MTLHQAALAMTLTIVIGPQSIGQVASSPALTHVSNSSHFEIGASFGRVAPHFGPEAERCWAGKHWNPEFLYTRPAKDIPGSVFQVEHGQHTSVWVNTLFDLAGGKIQYVAFIDGIVVTTLDIKLTSVGASHTNVDVTSTRTALQPAANDDVRALGESDRDDGPDTKKAIEKCLAVEPK